MPAFLPGLFLEHYLTGDVFKVKIMEHQHSLRRTRLSVSEKTEIMSM